MQHPQSLDRDKPGENESPLISRASLFLITTPPEKQEGQQISGALQSKSSLGLGSLVLLPDVSTMGLKGGQIWPSLPQCLVLKELRTNSSLDFISSQWQGGF